MACPKAEILPADTSLPADFVPMNKMRLARFAVALPLLIAGIGPAQAATCTQERASYIDSQGVYELRFEPIDPESSASTHVFKISLKNSKLVLDGYVMASEPVDRSNGILFDNCPEGDVTGADLAACTVWQGVVYSQHDGKIDLLPQQGQPAAEQILLPGFGPALQASTAWGRGKASVVPWDVMTLKDCR